MPQLFNGCHREELHPAAVQVGKAIKCNDVAIFLLKLLSIQLPTWKAVFSKVDAIQLGKGNSYVLTNQSFTQLWHDDIIIEILTHNKLCSEWRIQTILNFSVRHSEGV